MPSIDIRFVTSNALSSSLIRWQAGVSMPFTPSHTEALTKDGRSYIGAHIEDGIRKRPLGYDDDQVMILPDGRKASTIVTLPCTQAQEDAFYASLEAKVGAPYDWKAIIGFGVPGHLHEFGHLICSAFMMAELRAKGVEWFRWPTTKPFHHVSPDYLLFALSTHVEIPH